MAIEKDQLAIELERLEASINREKRSIEIGEAIGRLHENPDFQLVIEEAFMEDEAQRVLEVLVTPMNLKREPLDNLMMRLESIRDLRDFFRIKLIEANGAEGQIQALEEDKTSLLNGDDNIETVEVADTTEYDS